MTGRAFKRKTTTPDRWLIKSKEDINHVPNRYWIHSGLGWYSVPRDSLAHREALKELGHREDWEAMQSLKRWT